MLYVSSIKLPVNKFLIKSLKCDKSKLILKTGIKYQPFKNWRHFYFPDDFFNDKVRKSH